MNGAAAASSEGRAGEKPQRCAGEMPERQAARETPERPTGAGGLSVGDAHGNQGQKKFIPEFKRGGGGKTSNSYLLNNRPIAHSYFLTSYPLQHLITT